MAIESTRIALAQSVRGLVDCVQRAGQERSWAFADDGPAMDDWKQNERPNVRDPQPLQDAYRTGALYWNLVADQALSTADLIEAERRIGTLVVSRSLAEASTRMWYLLANEVEPAERIRRLVNDRLAGLYEDRRMARTEPSLDSQWHIGAKDELLAAYRSFGYPVVEETAYVAAHLGDPRPSAMVLVGDLINHSKGGALFYRLTSAVGHAHLHGLVKETDLIPDGGGAFRGYMARPSMPRVAADIMPALHCMVVAATHLMFQMGWDVAEFGEASAALLQVLTTLLDEPIPDMVSAIPINWT